MEQIKLKPVFVKTRNVRNFEVMMDGLALSEGEGRLGIVYGRAGRGKPRTSQWYQANNGCIYLRMITVWRTSELYFLQMLCREVGVLPPYRKGPAFTAFTDKMRSDPRPVFLDEMEKLPKFFLDLVRDLSDESKAPFILIGEDELLGYMRQNRKVWSRTFQQLQFDPIEIKDIIIFATETAGLKLTPQVAKLFYLSSEGDFRIVKRDILNLVQIANAKGTTEVTEDMAKIAIKTGLAGR